MIFDMLKRLKSVVYLPGDYVCKKVRADDVTNTTVVTCYELGSGILLYVANTDKRIDKHSETSQCSSIKYKHSWNQSTNQISEPELYNRN